MKNNIYSLMQFSAVKAMYIVMCCIIAAGCVEPAFSQVQRSLPLIHACDFCLASQGISPLEVGSTGIRFDVRYLHVGTMYRDGSRAENSGHEIETHLTEQYTLFYAVSPQLTFSALLPTPWRHSEEMDEDGNKVTGNQYGLGDISLLARYKVFEDHDMTATTILSLNGGVKLPTGRTNGKDSKGDLLDAHIQLGTGSTDVLVGAGGFIGLDQIAVITNVLGALTGTGANGHRFGNSLNYDATVRYRLYAQASGLPAFFATFGINGELRGHEIQDGEQVEDSGGQVIYLSPGVQAFITSALTVEVMYQIPVLHALHGEQLGEDYRIMSGLQLLF